MLSVKKCIIKDSNHQPNKGFNYPKLINIFPKNNSHESLINKVNEEILQDVLFFKDTIEYNTDETDNAFTDYEVSLKKGQIISLSIEFCELFNSHNITYINTYNYDISKNKRLGYSDIFKEDTNYLKIINEEIQCKLDRLKNKSKSIELKTYLENISKKIEIDEEQAFYLKPDEIVICFSSYELGIIFKNPVKISIKFEDYKDCLSDYTINEIWEVDEE